MKNVMIAAVLLSGVSMAAIAGPGGEGRGGRGFDRMDVNGDGLITAEEITENGAAMVEKADADGDGAVSKDEMRAYHEAKRAEWREKRNPDKNKDGVVDRTEFITAAQERFDRMDKNGDGVLSEDERERRRGRHGRRHQK